MQRRTGEAVELIELGTGNVEEAAQLPPVGVVAAIHGGEQVVQLAGETVGSRRHSSYPILRVRLEPRGSASEREQRVVVHRLAVQVRVGRGAQSDALVDLHAVLRCLWMRCRP